MTDELVIRVAGEPDCEALGFVAPAAYAAAYHDLWPEAVHLARHLETFGSAAFRKFLSTPGAHVWLVESGGLPVGFLSLQLDSPDPIYRREGGAEIPRIFLLPNVRRKGVGRRLLEPALEKAREERASYVWLDAMDSADWAIAAYLNWGFSPIGETVFPKAVVSDRAGMIVLRLELG